MKKTVLAVSALIVDADDRVLLVLRGHQPAQGLWSVPGGSVEVGENLEEALVREIAEETALHVVVEKKVWVATVELSAEADYEIHCFACSVMGGELMAGDDAAAARFVGGQDYDNLETTPQLTALLAKAGWPRGSGESGGPLRV